MENVVDFPEREQIDNQALEWLIRLDGDSPLTIEEERQLEAWLARSPAHRDALKNLNRFWSDANRLGELIEPQQVKALCWRRLRNLLATPFQTPVQRRLASVISLTAVLVLSLLGVAGFWPQDITASNGLYLTAVGQQKTVTLADQSQIQLNTNSQVEVSYTEGFRNIHVLQGEVYFEVAKDKAKPFRVYAGNGRVQAIGTAFNIYLQDKDVNVIVTEGRVAVASVLPAANAPEAAAAGAEQDSYAKTIPRRLGTLDAGQEATLKNSPPEPSATEHTATVSLVAAAGQSLAADRLSWREGLLIFSGETLEAVLAEVERYTPVEIDIATPALRAVQVGGQIQVSDTEAMFKALETNFGVKVQRISYNRVRVIAVN